MPDSISAQDYQSFKDFLETSCGILLGEGKQYLVTSRLGKLLRERGIDSFSTLLSAIQHPANTKLRDQVVDIMTTNETSWFRDHAPFECLVNQIFQEIDARKSHPCRIWSAACSSGQEPYTISMSLNEYLASHPHSLLHNTAILATDISATMIEAARQACYDESVLERGLTAEQQRRYFRQYNGKWQVIEAVRQRVHFQQLNLLDSFATLGPFDVVFCRNVLIYFSPARKSDILERIAARMKPEGYLFLGASETITGYSDAFAMKRGPYGVYYQLKR